RPDILLRQSSLRGLIKHLVFRNTIGGWQTRYAALRPHCQVSLIQIAPHLLHSLLNIPAIGVSIDHDAGATGPAKQVVQRRVQRLCLDVPQGHVHGGNGGHGYRASSPIGPSIQILPDVLSLKGIAANDARDDVVREITGYGKLSAIEGAISQAVNAFICEDLQGYKISSGRADEDLSICDLHAQPRLLIMDE